MYGTRRISTASGSERVSRIGLSGQATLATARGTDPYTQMQTDLVSPFF